MFINTLFMQMHIAPTRQVSELQLEFNNAFPFLRIEFFRPAEGNSLKHPTINKLPATTQVGNCQLVKTEGDIIITEETRVGDLENKLLKEFSLNVQVFRRSGTIWLETTMTDKWTLKQQNDHGREISSERNTPQNDGPTDYELHRDADH